jgi:hypothetical protein
MKLNYYITLHAVERLQERFGAFCSKHPDLKKWKRGDDISGVRLIIEDLVELSEENKSFINDSRYMVYIHERYGYDCTYRFLEVKSEQMLLIMCQSPERPFRLITIVPSSYRPMARVTKFSSKAAKEQCSDQEYISPAFVKQPEEPLPEPVPEIVEEPVDEELQTHLCPQLVFDLLQGVQASKQGLMNRQCQVVRHDTLNRPVFRMVVRGVQYDFLFRKKERDNYLKKVRLVDVVKLD